MVRRTDDTLRCSFCGKSQNEVKKLIAGPTVYICNECIDICNEIITDDQQAESVASRPPLPKPNEIKAFLDEYVIGQDETKKRLATAARRSSMGKSWCQRERNCRASSGDAARLQVGIRGRAVTHHPMVYSCGRAAFTVRLRRAKESSRLRMASASSWLNGNAGSKF